MAGLQDSSQSDTETCPPPLPLELPVEPPPVPPLAPVAAPPEDLTVVTTFTSFLPHHPPPTMGYLPPDMLPFNNWMGSNMPVRDMGPNMYGPPQFYNSPVQQQFPYLNQPPPHLPYQMQRYHHPPPLCHQRFQAPNQGPTLNMNFINVSQEVPNVKPNSVVNTQVPDSDNDVEILSADVIPKPISGSKCKYNPLRQNHQTVQEAIDSVKKCLKKFEGLSNKDPRLAAAVQVRSISPESNEHEASFIDKKSYPDEGKVKITMNYKPRPVSSVDEVSCFEPEVGIDMNEKNSAVSELKTKSNNYFDRSFKIEGIVSKLKDTIGNSSKSDEPCRSQTQEPEDLNSNTTTGEDLYDPFSEHEGNVQEATQKGATISETLKTSNDKSVTSTVICELSPALVERINSEIDEAFDFILSQPLERNRLTPTLDAIKAQKAEDQKKLNHIQTKPMQFPWHALVNVENAEKNGDSCGNKMKVQINTDTITKSPNHKNNIEQQPLLTYNSHEPNNYPEGDHQEPKSCVMSEKIKVNLVEENLKDLDTIVGETTKSDASSENTPKDSKVYVNKSACPESNVLKKTASFVQDNIIIDYDNDSSRSPVKELDNNEKSLQDFESNSDFCTESVLEKHKTDKLFFNHVDHNIEIKPEILEKKHGILESDINKMCRTKEKKEHIPNPTKSQDLYKSQHIQTLKDSEKTKNVCETDEKINLATSQTTNVNEDRLLNTTVTNEYFNASLKNCSNKERIGIPCLSIPTKGELKRFPTPERNPLKGSESSPDNKASNTNIDKQTNKSKKDISKNETEEQIVKPVYFKTVVESILNDFEDSRSSSAGSDSQEIRKSKDALTKERSNLSLFKKICINERKQVDHNTCDAQLTDIEISNTNECQGLSLADFNEVNIHKENNSQHSIDIKAEFLQSKDHLIGENIALDDGCDDSKEEERNIIKSKTKNEILNVRKKSRPEKPGLDVSAGKKENSYRIKNEHINTGCQVTKTLSKSNKFKDSNYHEEITTLNDIVHGETSNNYQRQANEGQDSQSYVAKTPVTLDSVRNVQPKPGPLSKKSKSYISKNLPDSFDLTVDGPLIQKGKFV